MTHTSEQGQNRRTVLLLVGVVAGMFAFGFALPPLYSVVCDALGIQTITKVSASSAPTTDVAPGRWVTVRLDATVNNNLPWAVSPEVRKFRVRTGEMVQTHFTVKNLSAESIEAQAIPSVVPWEATDHLQKIECFCFNRQQLAAGESKEMPLNFLVSADLPESINTLTLSYTVMNTIAGVPKMDGKTHGETHPHDDRS
ncbi:MAG: cytochrome c oxidase assembly protein [Proteobacteria bacterium]|nr:cytochrome c oxidase assembly protein [Pseudomonadota bacterium]